MSKRRFLSTNWRNQWLDIQDKTKNSPVTTIRPANKRKQSPAKGCD